MLSTISPKTKVVNQTIQQINKALFFCRKNKYASNYHDSINDKIIQYQFGQNIPVRLDTWATHINQPGIQIFVNSGKIGAIVMAKKQESMKHHER